jgi:hypothetical protein
MAASTALINNLATYFGSICTHGALYTSIPSTSAGTEVSGGSPAYARKSITWGGPTNGVNTGTVTFDVPTGITIRGAGLHSALTGGTYYCGTAVTDQSVPAQGTYTCTFTVNATAS